MKALIVEDEILAAQALESLIQDIDPAIEILANLQSIDESIEWFKFNQAPDLVFMDIHLADGSSFAIFDDITINCPIVFTTAYDEYALKAFQVNGIAYLLKPIKKTDLENAINRCKKLFHNPAVDNGSLLKKLIEDLRKEEQSKNKKLFLIPQKDKLIPLHVNDIAYIFIELKMIKAVTYANETYYLDQTLDEIYDQLNHWEFFRANRQFIVSRKSIKELSFWFGSKLSVTLTIPTPEKIIISKARVSEFKKWFAG